MSPEIVDINEKVFAPLGRIHSPHPQDEEESYDSYVLKHDENALPRSIPQTSSQLNVDTYSEPLTDWFTQESLKTAVREALGGNYDGSNGSGSLISSGRGVGTARSNRSREAFAPSEETASQSDEVVLTSTHQVTQLADIYRQNASHVDGVIAEELRRQSVSL